METMAFKLEIFFSCIKIKGSSSSDSCRNEKKKSNLQVLSFMFVPNCRLCPLPLNLTSFVLNVSKSYMLCPLALTQSVFFC
ncbi:hypothetical protein Hanom_Chr04g00341981 [Helianthus anomalus]